MAESVPQAARHRRRRALPTLCESCPLRNDCRGWWPRCRPPRHTLLVIADEADVLECIRQLRPRPYPVAETTKPAVAVEILKRRAVHLILADRRRPTMAGVEFLMRVRAEQAKTVRLLLTGRADRKAVIRALRCGQVRCYRSDRGEPLNDTAAIRPAGTVQAYDTTVEGWSRALAASAAETDGHSRRVSESGVRLAREMGMDEAQLVHIRRGALLHDVGKVGIPDRILAKPGPLTNEERNIMKRHACYGYQLLAPLAFLQEALVIPYCHHERWDGTGYPRGLKGEEIPLAARVFAVIDVWDALCSDRPYRKAWSKQQARAYIRSLSGLQFDPSVVARFLRMVV